VHVPTIAEDRRFDEQFRQLVPAEYRGTLDARRAAFHYAQGDLSLASGFMEAASGLLRAYLEWRADQP
jgi:hypothetical protein